MADETTEQQMEQERLAEALEVPKVLTADDLPEWLRQDDATEQVAMDLPRAASTLVGGVERLLELPSLQERKDEAEAEREAAESYEVESSEDADEAAERVRELREREKANNRAVSAVIDPIRKRGLDPLYELRRELTNPLSAAQKALKREIKAWNREQERKRRERERERKRKAQEEARKRREAEFDKAMEEGDEERAEAIAENVDAPAKPAPEPTDEEDEEPKQPSGTHTVDRWKMRLEGETQEQQQESLRKLAAAVAEGNAPAALLQVNEKKANEMAKATNGEITFPGLECWNDQTVVVR